MPTTTIKVPVELRDRLAVVAGREKTTLAGAIAASLDAAESARFWSDLARALTDEQGRRSLTGESTRFAASLADGLDREETWDDVW